MERLVGLVPQEMLDEQENEEPPEKTVVQVTLV